MPITVPDVIAEKGRGDAKRHRDKQKEIIKENIPKIISEESIITGKRDKKVKVRIKSIEIPYFRPGKTGPGIGVGQGEGEPGDIIGHKPGNKNKPGQAGDEPGEDWIDSEVELAEIIEMMLEELGLPRLEEKEMKTLLTELGYKIAGRDKTGIWSLLDSKATQKEGMKRFWFTLEALMEETGLPQLICYDALKKTEGDFGDAQNLLQDPNFAPTAETIEPFPIFASDDLRFLRIDPDIKEQSQAVIIAMMDVSGSMSDEKKYRARSMLFWLAEFLRQIYVKVEIRFVIHETTAKIVPEEDFFHTGEGGGTYSYTAFEMANGLVDTEYPTNQYNVYVWYFGDGDDWHDSPPRTIEEVNKLFQKGVNMIGYGEMDDGLINTQSNSTLMKTFRNYFELQQIVDNDLEMWSGKAIPFLAMTIRKREHIWPALKQFLKKDRWANA